LALSLEDKENAEILFYRDAEHEKPEADSLPNLLNKMQDCAVFVSVLPKFDDIFRNATDVLEIGGGQGWASCALKKLYPKLRVTLTDISEYAVKSCHKWERVFGTSIDESFACRSYEIPKPDASLDCVFCFSSAHHFVKHSETLKEIKRVLRKGGHCLYLHEVTTSRLMYRWAHARVNRRGVVPEDVIIHKDLLSAAREMELTATIQFNPTLLKRGPAETLYYFVLGRLGFLQPLLPCSANFRFDKV